MKDFDMLARQCREWWRVRTAAEKMHLCETVFFPDLPGEDDRFRTLMKAAIAKSLFGPISTPTTWEHWQLLCNAFHVDPEAMLNRLIEGKDYANSTETAERQK